MQTTYEFLQAPQGDVLAEYMALRGRVTFIMGPIGSGKTYGSCQRIFTQMCEQEPNSSGMRKSRWIAVRNTYPDLKGTTIKDWRELYDNDEVKLGKFNMDFPPTHSLDFDLPDGTRVISEIVFLALDRPDSVRKLRGLQVTGFWLNEVKELSKSVVDMCDGRHGRYPDNCSWHGMIGDTNAPDTDHWYYKLAEEVKPDGWTFLKQPGGVLEIIEGPIGNRRHKWVPNPQAENINNLPDGYYIRQVQSKSPDWIRVNLANKYGHVSTGKPIYEGIWDKERHTARFPLAAMPKIPKILVGIDFGRTPAAVFGQLLPNGKLRIIKELVATSMGIRKFMDELVMPLIKVDLKRHKLSDIEFYGDPSGTAKSGNDENSPLGIINDEYGITAYPTATNNPQRRWEAVGTFLLGDIDGKPAFELSPCCTVLGKGFDGGYQFRRMNVSGEKYADKADKNEYSHVADACQYLAQGAQGEINYGWLDEHNQQSNHLQSAVADTTTGY